MIRNKKGNLPNLIIIGAQKCATTSMHYYLNLHPDISMSREKELDYFIHKLNLERDLDWYRSNFKKGNKILGESSPNYTFYPIFDNVPQSMYAIIPDVKLIYLLRDPIDRIISQYINEYAAGRENRLIEKVLHNIDEKNPYICRSKYYMQLEQYLEYFPASHILIITLEDLLKNQRQTLKRVFRFLKVDDSVWSKKFFIYWHRSRYKRRLTGTGLRLFDSPIIQLIKQLPFEVRGLVEKTVFYPFSRRIKRPVLSPGVRNKLYYALKDDVDSLRKFTGSKFETWSV